MHARRSPPATLLAVVTITLGVVLAGFLLVFGVANLINPDVYPAYLGRNTLVCVMLILSAAVLVYALFRPLSGGIALFACGVVFVFMIPNPVALPILLLAVLSVARGFLALPRASVGPDQA